MALDSYTNLKTAVADWLNRTDLTAQVPDFITLAEVEIKRRLRRTSVKGTLSITAESVAIPADVSELRSIWLSSTSMSQDVPIRLCTPEMLSERKARGSGATGRPTDMAVMAGYFVFAPAPDQTYTASIFYFQSLAVLSASNASNTVLVEAPDAYLYGALLQAAPYLEDESKMAVWQSKFDNAINQLNLQRENEEYNASLSAIRLPIVFTQ